MPIATGVQRTSRRRFLAFGALFLSLVATLCPTVGTPAASAETGPAPKAVFIVGPTGGLTDDNLADAETMARQAEAVGMDVRRVFFPNATWDNVLANVQGASFVVYMGHGYGWPSHYKRQMTESRQNGMGLNSFVGSGRNNYRYYGAKLIRDNIRLAPNAVVLLNHLCYAAGNGEAGMAFPSEDIARQRVDNMANGWLGAGARAVFAFTWTQKLNYPRALMTTDSTMDELFMTRSNGSPSGFVGWRNVRYESERTPGTINHLDPHRRKGYLRALSGDLNMNAAEFRSGVTAPVSPAPPHDPAEAPKITSLAAGSSTSRPAVIHW